MMNELPLSVPLSPLDGDDFTDRQWDVLLSICDAIVPAIRRDAIDLETEEDAIQQFCLEVPSQVPAFRQLLRRMIFHTIFPSEKTGLLRVVNILSYSAGSLILTGYTDFSSESSEVRQQVLYNWSQSSIGALRLLQRSLIFLTKQVWTRTSPSVPKLIGYPRIPTDCKVSPGHDFNFIQFPPFTGEKKKKEAEMPEILETDVVIVGSGCGGGVAARTFAEAGLRVIVVDKGFYWAPEYLPLSEEGGPLRLFMDGGIITDDGSVAITAGETWGGGGTINWSATLQLPGAVRRDWANTGLPLFTSTSFQESIDRVHEAMGVSTKHIQHTPGNRHLMEGARKLGWAHAEVPQNTGGSAHNCGHCCLGCRSGDKQGPASFWLPQAQSNGARFIEGFDVHRVLFKKQGGEQVATGITGTWTPRDEYLGITDKIKRATRRVTINASKVIVSAGTLQSPLLLLRSGIRNYHIGRNLYLHPVSMLGALHDEKDNPWDGPILTSVCTEFENLDGKNHGVKLETPSMTPFTYMVWMPWHNGEQYKQLVSKMGNMTGYISVCKDRDTGRVYPDAETGRCHVDYHPSRFDKKHVMEGLLALARINYVSGARELWTSSSPFEHFIREDEDDQATNDAKFEEWLKKVRAHGFPYPESLFVAAHQMGTCRMSASPKAGVVDQTGRVWGTRGLHVIDASVFPTASGVNPMSTVMAIADSLSRTLVKQWTAGKL